MLLYDTTTSSFWVFNASAWEEIATTKNAWSVTGNSGTDTTINFIGTTDATDLFYSK
ncbi:MAG: hypothetical protein IPP72_16345 [Chitinophagaceae bacterium]|nr:hypothetical protein [Chitinophagaceae bacterium]